MPPSTHKCAEYLAVVWTSARGRVPAIAFAAIVLAVGFMATMPALDGSPIEGSSAGCEVTDLGTIGAEVESELRADGRWTTGDCDSRFRAGSDAHTYRFEVAEGGRIRVDLASNEGDSYLYLLTEDGVRITDNDDGGAGLDARVERDLEPGVYMIEATTVGGRVRGPADFSLTVEPRSGLRADPPGIAGAGGWI